VTLTSLFPPSFPPLPPRRRRIDETIFPPPFPLRFRGRKAALSLPLFFPFSFISLGEEEAGRKKKGLKVHLDFSPPSFPLIYQANRKEEKRRGGQRTPLIPRILSSGDARREGGEEEASPVRGSSLSPPLLNDGEQANISSEYE